MSDMGFGRYMLTLNGKLGFHCHSKLMQITVLYHLVHILFVLYRYWLLDVTSLRINILECWQAMVDIDIAEISVIMLLVRISCCTCCTRRVYAVIIVNIVNIVVQVKFLRRL